MSARVLEFVVAEDSMLLTIEELWDKMPMTSKKYYDYDVDVYRHYKIAQLMRDKGE